MKNLKITVNGVVYDVQVEENDDSAVASSAATPATIPAKTAPTKPAAPKPAASSAGSETISSPMPGTIVSVNVDAGKAVKKGDILVVLEAMKMENEIKCPRDGVVASVSVNKGDTVDTGAALVSLQ